MATDLIKDGDWIKVTHPPVSEGGDGEVVYVRISSLNIGTNNNSNINVNAGFTDTLTLDVFNTLNFRRSLNWFNCFAFGNGVESNRIGDTFNTMKIAPGVKVSTVFEEYKEERKKYGLIYSGVYNDNSGINNLNQFVQAEKITKDINPVYGSIQKLHARDTDLITLCEDKVLKIMANKDAVFNADGNLQLTATENVLGQTIPFVGEYGISKNPESFVYEAYRSYFTDKQRGAVMRLSRDGLTPISNHGMKDWFRDNISTSRINLLGEDILTSESNWDLYSSSNVKIENGQAIIGYYNNDINSSKYGKVARLYKKNVFEVGKKYRITLQTGVHSGFTKETTRETEKLFLSFTSEGGGMLTLGGTEQDNKLVYKEFIAQGKDLNINQYQVNGRHDFDVNNNTTIEPEEMNLPGYTVLGGTLQTVREWVNGERIAAGAVDANNDGIPDGNDYNNQNWFYGATVPITRLIIEEIKIEPKLVGSYDDRQDEYNLTIHSSSPTTVTFREDVNGWVSFKSFVPENALSCANDYFTIKNGMLYQHHVNAVSNNTFYGNYTNSSLNVILNNTPGSIKSFHTLNYEGSDSRVEGIKMITVNRRVMSPPTGRYFEIESEEDFNYIKHFTGATESTTTSGARKITPFIKQYRNNILIKTGIISVYYPTVASGTFTPHGQFNDWNASDWQDGDIITTQQQEETVNHFNSMPKDGWYISDFTTDKDKGSLPEFIEKEGKWFNYIKGVKTDENYHYIDQNTNFGDFDIQGIGIVEEIDGHDITFTNTINSSLQVGDCLYYEKPSEILGDELIDFNASGPNEVAQGFTITNNTTVEWNSSNATGTGNSHPTYYFSNPSEIDFIEGERYRLTLTISNYTGTNPVGISHNAGVSGSARRTSDGRYTEDFTSDGQTPDIFARITNSATIQVSIKRILPGDVFGFTRLEADNLQKVGIATGLSNNTVTVDDSGIIPSKKDYVLFVKNQVVNKTSLKGYYANVKFENNSKRNAEIFSVASEITESSK